MGMEFAHERPTSSPFSRRRRTIHGRSVGEAEWNLCRVANQDGGLIAAFAHVSLLILMLGSVLCSSQDVGSEKPASHGRSCCCSSSSCAVRGRYCCLFHE